MAEQKNTSGIFEPLTKQMIAALALPKQNGPATRKQEKLRPPFQKRREAIESRPRSNNATAGGWWFWDQVHIHEQGPDLESHG